MICTAFVSQEGGYRCGCRDGFELQADGRSCAPALLCSQTCENNGRCFRGKCLCAPGFTGQRCEADIDECLASVSVHGCNYQCKNTFGDYECICAHGYSRLSDKKSCMVSQNRLFLLFRFSIIRDIGFTM
ncbi:unnamed protein product [Protopolystoma xenopodis]|uniref:EGF-like domain-containing protein n=1 Tax=Protopolystoma xenopodis TaxID=117903 RepID=A0A448WW93_9PLAT|nr:unnamed protein product [Protopolystoma xenopodis]